MLRLVAKDGELIESTPTEQIQVWDELEVGDLGRSFHKPYHQGFHGIVAIDKDGTGFVQISDESMDVIVEEEILNPSLEMLQFRCDYLVEELGFGAALL